MKNSRLRLAILNLYNGTPNQGMRAIRKIVNIYEDDLQWKEFDVRLNHEIPGTNFDIFICSGGPGNPLEGDGVWDKAFYNLLDEIWENNLDPSKPRKFVFFICHSFQMACNHFKIGKLRPRKSRSFGTFPCHRTRKGLKEPYFKGLDNPFYVADFRNYQVLEPQEEQIESLGAKILAIEKVRPHVDLERAIMAVRFSREIFGVQFHPEADPEGMLIHFEQDEQKNLVIREHGIRKFYGMMRDLKDPNKISLTHSIVLPAFLEDSIQVLKKKLVHDHS